MKPPYEITSSILKLITSISEKIGEVNANLLNKPSPKLRKQNRIKTIYSSLKMDDIPNLYEFKKFYPEGREWINVGNSSIIAPDGKVIAGPLEAKEGISYADINLQDIIKAKRMFDVVGHYSRPDVFNFNINQTNKN